MSNQEMGPRFSSEKLYATKAQVSKALGISMIDSIWQEIVKYRSNFSQNLNLSGVDQSAFTFVQTPYIVKIVNQFEAKLASIVLKYAQLESPRYREEFKILSYARSLSTIAKKYNIHKDDPRYFRRLISGGLSAVTPKELVLANYLSALEGIKKSTEETIDVDYIAKIFSEVSGNHELVSLYRETDLLDINQKVLVNPDFNPSDPINIEPMMESLYSFLLDENVSLIVRALCAAYYVNEVVPFEIYSEEMGLLILKSVFINSDYRDIVPFINFEILLLKDDNPELSNAIKEVKRMSDITYYIDASIRLLMTSLEESILDLGKARISNLQEEQYPLDEPEVEETLFEVKDDTHEEVEIEAEVKDEVVAQPGVEPELPDVEETEVELKLTKDTAISRFTIGYDEREARLLEQHLLESDPQLKKNEAYFYARHCTMGKYYTIDQFKKSLNCAYETARNSMDNLVLYGYYRKEMIKNKFIYTPIKKKG